MFDVNTADYYFIFGGLYINIPNETGFPNSSLTNEVLEEFRKRADEAGRGYQTMINEALRQYLGKDITPLDESTLRRVLREELKTV